MYLIEQRPEWFYAYIGVGQIVNMLEGEKELYQQLLRHAKENNKSELVEKVEAIIPMLELPSPQREAAFVENCPLVRMELSILAGKTAMRHLPLPDVITLFNFDRLISPHISDTDLSNAILGGRSALLRPPYTSLTKDFMDIDLPNQLGFSFDVPIFLFSGRHDYQTPVTLSDQWFVEIDAPHKELIHFEESSHMIVNEEPGRFLNELVNRVLPLSQLQTNVNAVQAIGAVDGQI
jgi:pimeloyl-ACP methyl ester carboxylesterase